MIKFLLSGNGFLDPYSTYLQFTVEVDLAASEDDKVDSGEVKTLDRSSHSFLQRMVIRSQGVELERVENYDVVAAMINDMIYSQEQSVLHHWEGFPSCEMPLMINEDPEFESLGAGKSTYSGGRELLFTQMSQGASYGKMPYLGETAFHNLPA